MEAPGAGARKRSIQSPGRLARWVVVAGLGLAPLLSAQPPVATVGYHIGAKDLLEIRVFEVPELNTERRVADDGTINLPLIGDVPVRDLTEGELAERLKALLESKYVQRASVTVQVREFRSKPIVVLGAVRQPGNLAFSGRWSLMEAILACGGLTEQRGPKLFVLRRSENGLTDQISIEVDDLLVKVDPDVNIPIFSNDVINVPVAETRTVYCLGEVARPGPVNFKSTERLTLLTAIAQVGGLTDRASRNVRIKRLGDADRWVEMEVDYKDILAGKRPDVELLAGDVIMVKESFF